MSGKIKNVFPGANTLDGFFSYYKYMTGENWNRFFILKGGPGTGKSSLMKKVGEFFVDRGYDIEYHHCSSDNESIDGVVIQSLKIAIVDGTAPHTIDPKLPGVVDEIINLGEYWDFKELKSNEDDVKRTTSEVSRYFARAYKFLGSAKPILLDIIEKYKDALDFARLNKTYLEISGELFKNIKENDRLGYERHLFSSAITPNGYIDFTNNILRGTKKVYYLDGDIVNGKSTLMDKIREVAINKGFDVDVYHHTLIPTKIQSIVIKGTDIALTSSEVCKENSYKIVTLNECLDKTIIKKYKSELEYDKNVFKKLIQEGINNISKAKEQHDILEEYYISNIDFDQIDAKKDEIIEMILNYE